MEKRAVIYIRVSDPSQVENNSLDTQEKICRQYATTHGYEVVQLFREEGESAKHVYTRDKLTELVKFCSNKKNQISYLIVYKMDRLSRNMVEGLQLITLLTTYGVLVRSATEQFGEDAAGTFLKNIVMAAAQYDNEQKGEKVTDNMKASFRGGLWPFKCPVGYKRRFRTKEENHGLPVIPHPELAPIVTQMFINAAQGIYTKSQLARIMNTEGFADHYRVPADHKIVHGILSKTFYYGRTYARKWDESAEGLHTPLIDEPTWQKAYHYLILKKKNYEYQDSTLYPLKGALRCEYCDHPMTSSPSRGSSGKLVYYYECKYKNCQKLRINAKLAHEQFEDLLSNIKPTDRVTKLFEHLVFTEWDKVIAQARKDIARYDHKINAQKNELRSIRKAKDDGTYTPDEAKEEAERVRQSIAIAEIERSDIRIQQYDREIVREFTRRFLENFPLLWNSLDLSKQQAFLYKVFEGVVICTKDKKIRTVKLSPSFELIQSLSEQNSENVSHTGLEPFDPITTVF